MTTLGKIERLMDLCEGLDFPGAANLLYRVQRRLGDHLIGEPCLNPDSDGLDCHSRTSEPAKWCPTCTAFAVEIGEV